MEPIRLGVSTCLLGEPVRFDGGHKLDRFVRDTLGRYVEFVPVCPEVECGLSIPREAMHLSGDPDAPRLVTVRTGKDLTDQMRSWAAGRVGELEGEQLCGFIFKSNSPSSGMERVKLHDANHIPSPRGVGLFARAFMDHFPLLPVEDDGRLHDAGLRENFIERIFIFKRWREMLEEPRKLKHLVEFHSRHKLLVMAHSPKILRDLGKLVAHAQELDASQLYADYLKLLMEALKLKRTVKKNSNVLQHMMGYFKKVLTPDEKQELLEVIGTYQNGHVPLIVPITLINHYVRKYREPYLSVQFFLNPHPIELQLLNHV
ncbi:MAG: DUF1722 domain-containing protein [Syntrophobacteraceae bacterium CG07_land_8_20_14_0_80_61_8]|nr:MAG: DUF1722 domain-containing protein [Syntrophobacteraceae bacterium CG07_land_8_20_14_0_80_61_8]